MSIAPNRSNVAAAAAWVCAEIGDVGGGRHDLALRAAHLLDHAIGLGAVDVSYGDRRAMGGKLHANGGANAGRPARYQGDLRGQKARSITALRHA